MLVPCERQTMFSHPEPHEIFFDEIEYSPPREWMGDKAKTNFDESDLIRHIQVQKVMAEASSSLYTYGLNGTINYFFSSENFAEEYNFLACVFEKFTVLKKDGVPIRAQVSKPNAFGRKLFAKVTDSGHLNPFLVHFILKRKYKEDMRSQVVFEIVPNVPETDARLLENLRNDPYLSMMGCIGRQFPDVFVDVSCFDMEEIRRDIYINVLAEQFTHSYLRVYRENGHYYKILKFY